MKRILSVFLASVICLCLFACKADEIQRNGGLSEPLPQNNEQIPADNTMDKQVNAGNEEAEKLLDNYLQTLEKIDTPTHEYGEHTSFISMDDRLVVNIIYPETGLGFLDEQIEAWIDETFEYYSDDASEAQMLSQPAELNVSCESHVENETYLSIKMTGFYNSEHLAHPVDIVKVFNADIKQYEMLDIKELFCDDMAYNNFYPFVANRLGVSHMDIDGHFLDNFYLKHGGVEITITRGSYLPMSSGTKSTFITKDELKDYLLLYEYDESIPETDEPLDEEQSKFSDDDGEIVSGEPSYPFTVDTSKPMIALTFDDGPSTHTERLLDIFKTYGGKGTFFVLGNLIDGKSETLKRTVNEGHEIGNHSWSHKQLTSISDEDITNEIMLTRAQIYDVTGVDCRIVRPPYGAVNENVLGIGEELGVSFVNWCVDTVDWKSKNADAVYNEIIGVVKNGDIVLCHDLHKTTVDAMELVIPKLIADGYQLVTVSELFEYSGKTLEAGKMHYCA